MGLSASQGRMLLLTARKSDLEFRAQQISQKRLLLSQQLEEIAMEYENATSNRQMKIYLHRTNTPEGQENEYNTQHANLTYAALISGTIADNVEGSGIQLGDKIPEQQFHSTSYYRLVNANGDIVVSHVSEIPTSKSSSQSKRSDEPVNGSKGIYHPTTTTKQADGTSSTEKKGAYAVIGNEETKITTGEGDDAKVETLESLEAFLANNGATKGEVSNVNGQPIYYNEEQGTIIVFDENKKAVYFDAATGRQLNKDDEEDKKRMQDTYDTANELTLVRSQDDIYNEIIEYSNTSLIDGNELEPMPGTDNRYRVGGFTYVVDASLRSGSTDTAGSRTSPNYLQDCLRNGKYTIEQATKNQDTGKYEWRSTSWDTTANISDGYYTEDDDKAKIKYDRLQQQIQAQDKKLELELDNIETQRQAVTTEQESVKKVINENIEGSFNAFA